MAEIPSQENKDYGLPKVEKQPIDREQPGIAKEVIAVKEDPEEKDNRLVIIALSVVGFLILASIFYMIFWNDSSDSSGGDNISAQQTVVDNDESTETSDNSLSETTEGDEAEVPEETIVEEEPGSIVTISQRTNRYYIFVGSYKFKAYAQRHAKKLADDGFAVKLIVPDNWVGMRVAVGNYGSKNEANADAQQIRSKYGNEVVISRY